MTIEQIRGLIGQAKLDKALAAAAEYPGIKADDDLGMSIILLQSRYANNEKDKNLGMKDDDDYSKERAKISYSLITVLADLAEEEAGSTAPSIASPSVPQVEAVVEAPTVISDDETIIRILFLAANPSDTAKLKLTAEHSRVSARLQEALEPERFPLKFRQAVTPSEFSDYLFTEKPNIVHFSGHGDRKAPDVMTMMSESRAGRKPEDLPAAAQQADESGIFLLDEDKRHAHFVNTTFLTRTFKTMVNRHHIPIKAVVFNACHSSQQAEAISKIVPYVVGTSWSVGDDAATAFASGFYFGIAQGMDIENAVDYGINQALAFNEPEDRFLLYKDGVKVEW